MVKKKCSEYDGKCDGKVDSFGFVCYIEITMRPWLKVLSQLSVNLSAAWFAVAAVSIGFTDLFGAAGFIYFIRDIICGVLLLTSAAKIEEALRE